MVLAVSTALYSSTREDRGCSCRKRVLEPEGGASLLGCAGESGWRCRRASGVAARRSRSSCSRSRGSARCRPRSVSSSSRRTRRRDSEEVRIGRTSARRGRSLRFRSSDLLETRSRRARHGARSVTASRRRRGHGHGSVRRRSGDRSCTEVRRRSMRRRRAEPKCESCDSSESPSFAGWQQREPQRRVAFTRRNEYLRFVCSGTNDNRPRSPRITLRRHGQLIVVREPPVPRGRVSRNRAARSRTGRLGFEPVKYGSNGARELRVLFRVYSGFSTFRLAKSSAISVTIFVMRSASIGPKRCM